MTSNELSMLALGLALGSQGMNVLHAYWAGQTARRSAAASRALLKRLAGDRYLSSLRVYQIQHRLDGHR